MPLQLKAEPQLSGPMNYQIVRRVKLRVMMELTYVDQEAKGNDPGNKEEEINWPVDEGSSEWEEPQEGQEDGDASDDLGVDHALLLRLADSVAALVEVLSGDSGDNCGEGQLKSKSVCVSRCTNDVRATRRGEENVPGQRGEPFRGCGR